MIVNLFLLLLVVLHVARQQLVRADLGDVVPLGDCSADCTDTGKFDLAPEYLFANVTIAPSFKWTVKLKDGKQSEDFYQNMLEIWDPGAQESFLSVYLEPNSVELAFSHKDTLFLENGPVLKSGKDTYVTMQLYNGAFTVYSNQESEIFTAAFSGSLVASRKYLLFGTSAATTVKSSTGVPQVVAPAEGEIKSYNILGEKTICMFVKHELKGY